MLGGHTSQLDHLERRMVGLSFINVTDGIADHKKMIAHRVSRLVA
jgi:hypothetical protein